MTKSLYIIDGHAQIYAAFYAPMSANLTAPDGEPTKATFIFTTMIWKLLKEQQPDMLAVAMDAPGPTFRHQMFAPYKANRPAMPDELPVQIARIEQVLSAMRIPIFRVGGYEADDIIATLAHQAETKNLQVYICSKDKDLKQLLSEQVFMYDPKSSTLLDVAGLMESKGIRPDQVGDVLALEGDTSDNIPGIADVGPKTALQWIQKYGDLEHLLAHRNEIKGKRGENLRAGVEQLKLSRQLVRINREVPLEIDWSELAVKPLDRPKLASIFEMLGFRKLLTQLETQIDPSKLDEPTAPPTEPTITKQPKSTTKTEPTTDTPAGVTSVLLRQPGPPARADYQLVDTELAFERFYDRLKQQKSFAIDTETTGINPVAAQLVGLSFCWQAGQAYYLPVKAPLGRKCLDQQKVLSCLKGLLENETIKKTGQNIKYDIIVLRKTGIELAGVEFDTMVVSYVLDSARTRHSMDSLAADYLGYETIKLESLLGKGKKQLTFDTVDTRLAADYAAEDADITWQLKEYFQENLTDPDLRRLFTKVEMPLVEVLAELEYQGVALDVGFLKKISNRMDRRLEQLIQQIHKEAAMKFNVDSPKQLAEVLFGRLGLTPVKKTKKKEVSTDQEVLQSLSWQHPVAALMLEYRQLSKLKNTYVDKLPLMICPETKRLHTSFNQTVTATGRLSSSNPNMQNIPIRSELGQEIRRAFVPGNKNNVILAADYSQIELRLLAHLSNDGALIEAFNKGQDIHRFVASQVYGVPVDQVDSNQRSQAKAVNFGVIYGQTAYGLSRSIGISVDEAQRFINDYFKRYDKIEEFMDEIITRAKKDGYVRTILGRRRPITDLNSKNYSRRRLAERMAVNTVVQGSAADMIKVAMINIHQRLKREKLPVRMILQVHDELVFELPRNAAEQCGRMIQHEMATAIKMKVPVTVDWGWAETWLECK